MIRSFKALSALLRYPCDEVKAAVPELRAALDAEALLSAQQRAALAPLLSALAERDLYDAQEEYVFLFDRTRTLSLNLFEHIHGESRDRGDAMVALLETYREAGFDLATSELPDHLPVLLEFLAMQTLEDARALLADAGSVLAVLARRLTQRQTPYAAVLVALADLGGVSAQVCVASDEPLENPDDLEALDAVWEEAQVTFGPDPNAGCPPARDMLARMATPATAS